MVESLVRTITGRNLNEDDEYKNAGNEVNPINQLVKKLSGKNSRACEDLEAGKSDNNTVKIAKLKIAELIQEHKQLMGDVDLEEKKNEMQQMEETLFLKLQCDQLVAQYALTKTNY